MSNTPQSTEQQLDTIIDNLAFEAIQSRDDVEAWKTAKEEAVAKLKQLLVAERIAEAKHYCDEGHYHETERDIAMLPSERVKELWQLQQPTDTEGSEK